MDEEYRVKALNIDNFVGSLIYNVTWDKPSNNDCVKEGCLCDTYNRSIHVETDKGTFCIGVVSYASQLFLNTFIFNKKIVKRVR